MKNNICVICACCTILLFSSCERNGSVETLKGCWLETKSSPHHLADYYEISDNLMKMYSYNDKVNRFDSVSNQWVTCDTIPYWELQYMRRYDCDYNENFLTIYDVRVVNLLVFWEDGNNVIFKDENYPRIDLTYINLVRTTKNNSIADYKKIQGK